MSSAGGGTIAALSGGSGTDPSAAKDAELVSAIDAAPSARTAPASLRAVSLLTTNARFADRIRQAFRGTQEIELQIVPLPDAVTSVHRLACDCAARVLVIDAALFERGLIVPQLGPTIPFQSFHLLLVLDRVDRRAVQLSLQSGAHGCMEFEVAPERFLQAVDVVANGEFWFPRWMMDTFYELAQAAVSRQAEAVPRSRQSVSEELTQREVEVMGLVRHGLTNKEIARELCISPSTVKKHVHGAMQKLGFAHRRQVV